MAHLHRFHIGAGDIADGIAQLPSDEAHHAARVVRLREGDEVALFDGAGKEWHGEIEECGKRRVTVRIQHTREVAPPARKVTLAIAALNQDRPMEEVLRRGTEMGVNNFIFYRAERSERPVRIRDKWQRLLIESCKQCGRLWLPEIAGAESLGAALDMTASPRLLFTSDLPTRPLAEAVATGSPAIFIGPEGDFTDGEREQALAAGATPVWLGEYTLRAEVAAIAAVTIVQYELGALSGP